MLSALSSHVPAEDELFSVYEHAERVGLHPVTLRRYRRYGLLPDRKRVRNGVSGYYWTEAEVDAALTRLPPATLEDIKGWAAIQAKAAGPLAEDRIAIVLNQLERALRAVAEEAHSSNGRHTLSGGEA